MIGEGVPASLLEALRREGLDTVEGAFAYGGGEDLAKAGLAGRRRTRLEVTDGDGRTHAMYLKRYGPGIAGALRRWARQGRRGSAAGIEFENIRRARAAGVPTMQPVLCGEDPCPIGAKRSYLIVTAVPGDAMERCFEAFFRSHAGDGEVRAVTVKLARLVRRLHDTGHAHRDLYASHVFLDESAGGAGLYLIDLARMFPARVRRSRWFARDLAQLKYSMPAAWVAAFWQALLAEYLPGVSPAAIRRLDEAVDRKVAGIRAGRTPTQAQPGGTRTMKIALVIERFDPSRGGRELSTAQTASALARRGQDVTIFCQSCHDACEGVRVLPLKARGLDRTARLASFVKSVRGAAEDGGYDIIHATLPVPGASVYQPRGGLVGAQAAASLRRRRSGGRFGAVLAQSLNHQRRRMRRLERRLVADPRTLCLAVSEMVAREFMHYYARSDGVRVIYNAVEVPDVGDEQRARWRREYRQRVSVAPGSPVFLTVAKNFALKGVAEAIEAFAQWYHSPAGSRDARLVAVGRRKVRRYRRLAARRGVARQVVFAGPTDDVFPWYAAADVCVLLSWYDPCSRVVLEATRWGIPSITTVYNGAAEVLARGAGIVVGSPRDTSAVVKAMTELAGADGRAVRSEACRQVADRLGMDRHVDELLEAYAEVAGRR